MLSFSQFGMKVYLTYGNDVHPLWNERLFRGQKIDMYYEPETPIEETSLPPLRTDWELARMPSLHGAEIKRLDFCSIGTMYQRDNRT